MVWSGKRRKGRVRGNVIKEGRLKNVRKNRRGINKIKKRVWGVWVK